MKHFLKTKHLCSFLFIKEHKTLASFLVEGLLCFLMKMNSGIDINDYHLNFPYMSNLLFSPPC